MPKTTMPPSSVDEAEAALAAVHARLQAGDGTVTPDELHRAESAVRFAVARQAAEERAEAERRARARQAAVQALRARVMAELDPAPLVEARAALEAAITAFVTTAARHDAAYRDLWAEVSGVADLPADLGIEDGSRHLRAGGRVYGPARPQMTISRAALAALREHYPRSQINLNQPPD